MSNARVQKRQLEKARQEKAAAKRERRQTKGVGDETAVEDVDGTPTASEAEVLAALAALHEQYADGQMSLEDFETARTELVDRLTVN